MNTAVDRNTLIVNVDSLNNQQYNNVNEFIDYYELIEALSDLVDMYIMCSKLSESERADIVKRIWFLTSKWIEIIGSVKYIPGLINELSESIKVKLWNTDIDCDILKELFARTYLLKRESEVDMKEVSEYKDLVYNLIVKLGYSGNNEFINNLFNTSDPENLITIAVLSIILSTNIESDFLD